MKTPKTHEIFRNAYNQAMPEHGEGWDGFASRIKLEMQGMEDLLRDAVDHIDRRTVAGVKVQDSIEGFLSQNH
jgi:hypothetical protein